MGTTKKENRSSQHCSGCPKYLQVQERAMKKLKKMTKSKSETDRKKSKSANMNRACLNWGAEGNLWV